MEKIELIESVVGAAIEVWQDITDYDTRRGAALVVGKLLAELEDLDLQEWVGQSVIMGQGGVGL